MAEIMIEHGQEIENFLKEHSEAMENAMQRLTELAVKASKAITIIADHARDAMGRMLTIMFDPKNYMFAPITKRDILREAKRRNRQRRLEKVKKTWAISVQMYKILGKGSAKAARQSARKYGYDYIGVCGEYMNIFKVPKFEPDIPHIDDCVRYIPGIAWGMGSAEGFVLLKKEEGDTDANDR